GTGVPCSHMQSASASRSRSSLSRSTPARSSRSSAARTSPGSWASSSPLCSTTSSSAITESHQGKLSIPKWTSSHGRNSQQPAPGTWYCLTRLHCLEARQVSAQQDSHQPNTSTIGALERFPIGKSPQSADAHCATTEEPRCYQSVLLSSSICDARHHTGTAPRVTSMTISPSTRSATPPLSARSQRRDP